MKLNLGIAAFVAGGVSAETIRGLGVQRELAFKSLVFVGEPDTHPGKFPLGRCKGDCDNDAECRDLLQCFKREPGSVVKVPGCFDDVHKFDNPGKDYCTQRDREGVGSWLMKVGDNGVREDNGMSMVLDPLGKCMGDCDIDEHCKDGLKCDLRDGTVFVPGCLNEGGDPGEDYCIPE
eukprot:95441_1